MTLENIEKWEKHYDEGKEDKKLSIVDILFIVMIFIVFIAGFILGVYYAK